MTDLETVERVIRDNAIQWNKQQFYRAIGQERFDDAERYKKNIDFLEQAQGGDLEKQKPGA